MVFGLPFLSKIDGLCLYFLTNFDRCESSPVRKPQGYFSSERSV